MVFWEKMSLVWVKLVYGVPYEDRKTKTKGGPRAVRGKDKGRDSRKCCIGIDFMVSCFMKRGSSYQFTQRNCFLMIWLVE